MRSAIFLFVGGVAIAPCTGLAADAESIEAKLNASGLCETLPDLDVIQVAEMLGVSIGIPSFFPVDLTARWDKDRHTVKTYSMSDEGSVIEIGISCEPSEASAVISTLPISAADIRLSDNARCEGPVNGTDMTCEVSGEIGSFIAQMVDLDSYVTWSVREDTGLQ